VTELDQSVPGLSKAANQWSDKVSASEAALEQLMESFKDQVAALREKLIGQQQALAPWSTQLSDQQAKLDILASELSLLNEKQSDAESSLARVQEQIEHTKKQIVDKVFFFFKRFIN
jgi:chromosome segregation ATPase